MKNDIENIISSWFLVIDSNESTQNGRYYLVRRFSNKINTMHFHRLHEFVHQSRYYKINERKFIAQCFFIVFYFGYH